jgi:protein CpxP
MNKSKFFITTIVVLLITNLLLVGFLVFRKPPHPPMDGPKKLIIQSLHFNKNQVNEYTKLIEVHKTDILNLKKKLEKSKGRLYATLASESNDELKTDSIFSVIATIESEIELLNYNHFMDIKKICNQDQLNNFKELTSKMAQFFTPKPPRKR